MRTLAFLLLAACSAPQPGTRTAAPRSGSAAFREAYTRTLAVEIDGTVVGYLVRYEAPPVPDTDSRVLPTGSHRIQDPEFTDVGFITPRGEVFRHHPAGGATSLGHHQLERGLNEFFGPGQLKLRSLEERRPEPAEAVEEAVEESADAEEE